MKTVVSVQEIAEFEIKPRGDLDRWRALVEAEIAQRWADRSGWIHVSCPACGQKDTTPAFERYGIAYAECPVCGSLYAPFRPPEDDLWVWYRESEPARFWREHILPATDSARREKMTRPRADWVLDGIAEYFPSAKRLVDMSPYGKGLADIVAAENTVLTDIVTAAKTADLEGVSTPRVKVQPTRGAELPGLGPVDVIIAVDVLDRAADMFALIDTFNQMLAKRGLIFATVPVSSGFEIQSLWERSPTIIPPDKLNLPSVEGLQKLFAGPVWEILELSTPGMFDVEMVHRAIKAEPNAAWPRVVRALVERTDAEGRTALVEFLQSRRLTSFARLVVRKVR